MDLRLKFDEDVLNYDKHRPNYTPKLFDDIISYSKLDHSKKALEIGIGTGQATLPFLKTGCEVQAVELGIHMAEYVKQKFSSFDNFKVNAISFEDFATESNQYDVIYSATAFHWIPQKLGFRKAYTLLKSGGTIALFWNHPSVNHTDDGLYVKIQKAYNKYMPSEKPPAEFDISICKQYADHMLKYGLVDVVWKIYQKTRVLTSKDYLSLLYTYSDHRSLPNHVKDSLFNEIAAAIDQFGGTITIYDTMDLYLARKP